MESYSRPVLRQLGRMDAVTLKSGDNTDIGGEFTGSNLTWWQQLFCLIDPSQPYCGLDGGTGAPAQSGSGSFDA